MSLHFSQLSKLVPTPFNCSIQSFLPQILFTNNSIAQLRIYPYRISEITRTKLHKISINTQIHLIYYYHHQHFHLRCHIRFHKLEGLTALLEIVGTYVPYRILQVHSCPTGHCRSLCALPDIVGAFEPYRTQQEPMCPIVHSRSLRALSNIVGAFEPYRT